MSTKIAVQKIGFFFGQKIFFNQFFSAKYFFVLAKKEKEFIWKKIMAKKRFIRNFFVKIKNIWLKKIPIEKNLNQKKLLLKKNWRKKIWVKKPILTATPYLTSPSQFPYPRPCLSSSSSSFYFKLLSQNREKPSGIE